MIFGNYSGAIYKLPGLGSLLVQGSSTPGFAVSVARKHSWGGGPVYGSEAMFAAIC